MPGDFQGGSLKTACIVYWMTVLTPSLQAKNTRRALPNRSIIPAWGPCPKAGCGVTARISAIAFGTRLDISTEVVYDSGIAMAADRVGRAHRRSDHPSHLPQYPDHAGGRSTLPR